MGKYIFSKTLAGLGVEVVGEGDSRTLKLFKIIGESGGSGDLALKSSGPQSLDGEHVGRMGGHGEHDELYRMGADLFPEI